VPVNFNLTLSDQEIEADKYYQLLGIINWQGDMIWAENKRLRGSELLNRKSINMITKRTPARLLTFKGEKDFKVRFFNSMAQLIIEDEEYILPQQRTASGAKFVNSELSIWNKGREISFEKDGKNYKSYLTSLADLNLESDIVEVRGQKPYWEAKIDKNVLELKYDYLTNNIKIPMSNIEIIEKPNSLIYRVKTSFLDFEIKLLNDIHADQMSGKTYPLTAFIKINGEKYIGGADLN
jgi:membrane-bound inhibitor of C-type lysozyme